MPKLTINCPVCGIKKERYVYDESRTYYCSVKCRDESYRTKLKGPSNPNYGKKWGQESKSIASSRMIEVMKDPARRQISGSGNRGVTFSDDRRRNMSNAKKGKPGKPHSEDSRRKIGAASSARMKTDEMKARIRISKENLGQWVPLDKISPFKRYIKESNWIASMFDRVQGDEKELLSTLGVFNCKTNPKGVVRDHMYSRNSVFNNKVPPQILRHPCNCQIITHSDNIRKKTGRYTDGNSQSLEELFNMILVYKGIWEEHPLVLELITDYRKGLRWT